MASNNVTDLNMSAPSPRTCRRAVPTNSVLQVYLGMVLHANKRYLDALDMLELASKSEPRNPQVLYAHNHGAF